MKYWFFDGNDVVGPFAPQELAANKSFGATSLICPEEFSDDGDHWQPAALFAEIKNLLSQTESDNEENTETFEEEMDTLLKQHSPLSFDEAPTDGPGLQIPKKPAKPGPIEDYFNHIKEEDLGDILGIPDPNDNSDMDLAHALEKQLAKTSSTRRRELQEFSNEADEKTVQRLEATHHVATATEVFGTQVQLVEKSPTLPTLPSATMPVLAAEPAAAPAPLEKITPLNVQPAAEEPKTIPPLQPVFTPEKSTIQQPTPEEKPVELVTETKEPGIIPDPALLRAEQVEVNSVRAKLKQTQEMKDFLHETQISHLKTRQHLERKITVALLAALAIIGALLLMLQLSRNSKGYSAQPTSKTTAPTHAQELLSEPPAAVTPPPAQPIPVSQEQKALAIVQNYQLSGGRGTLATYLNRIYQTQLAQGYRAAWEAEPLYKNTYVVKYRLTKTRKEPIIYVFQADVAANKLTGALNNISLDLVGKI